MLTDAEIQEVLAEGLLRIDPFEPASLQPASYDVRVGHQAFISGGTEITNVEERGLVIIEPGEFAVVSTREKINCGPQMAGQIGLDSTFARQGLTLLSGPQIDPGFDGVLVVRVTNLSPNRVTLTFEAAFLTVQFFKLSRPSAKPYVGRRQGQEGITGKDIDQLIHAESQTIGGMVKSLASLATDVGSLSESVKTLSAKMGTLTWVIPVLVGFGIAVMGVIVSLK